MKLLKTTTTKVVAIDYDEVADCYFASIEDTVPVSVYTGCTNPIEIQERNLCYLEFSLISVSDICEGDTITIETYEHIKGERTALFNGEEYTFVGDGVHNIITNIEHHSADEGCVIPDDELGWDEIEAADIARHTGDPAPTPASGTIGAYVRDKIEEYQLEDIVVDHNADYTYVKVSKIDSSLKAMNFANFVAEAQLVSIRGNEDGSVSCWF